jgi:RsiW-degrading membrane proteinase PrsW (M82 family)
LLDFTVNAGEGIASVYCLRNEHPVKWVAVVFFLGMLLGIILLDLDLAFFTKSTNENHEKREITKFCNQLLARMLENSFYKNYICNYEKSIDFFVGFVALYRYIRGLCGRA